MNIEQFTRVMQTAITSANSLANTHSHNTIEPLHVLSVLRDDIASIITKSGGDMNALQSSINDELGNLPVVGKPDGNINISQSLNAIFNTCEKIAREMGDSFISVDVFLLAILQRNDITQKILTKCGVNTQSITQTITELRQGETVQDQNTENNREH